MADQLSAINRCRGLRKVSTGRQCWCSGSRTMHPLPGKAARSLHMRPRSIAVVSILCKWNCVSIGVAIRWHRHKYHWWKCNTFASQRSVFNFYKFLDDSYGSNKLIQQHERKYLRQNRNRCPSLKEYKISELALLRTSNSVSIEHFSTKLILDEWPFIALITWQATDTHVIAGKEECDRKPRI